MVLRASLLGLLLASAALAKFNAVIPTLDEDGWWGPGSRTAVSTELKPFTITYSEAFLQDLKYRLKNRRPFRQPLEGITFQDGFNVNILEPILDHWANGYNFEARLAYLNQYKQFKTNIDGLDLHFLWIKPKVPANIKVLPMIVMHGWPSSFREFTDAIPLLTTPRDGYDFVFELIIPSLPGFGFSDAPVRAGMGVAEVGVLMNKLMLRLGYKQYYVQGGDYGSVIGNAMITAFPDNILGYHTYSPYAIGAPYEARLKAYESLPTVLEPNTRRRTYPLSAKDAFWDSERGYSHLQRTKPDTVGVGLTDSPAGLAAYTLEKFSTGTDIENRNKTDGGFNSFNIDNLIDNLMIYWRSNCITTSLRYYKEFNGVKTASHKINEIPTPVPVWALQAYNELIVNPAKFMIDKYVNLLNITYSGVGGHYYAFMEPALYADDVFKAVQAFRLFHANGGKTCTNFRVDL